MRKKYYHAATPETMEKIIADGVVKRGWDGCVYLCEKPQDAAKFVAIRGHDEVAVIEVILPANVIKAETGHSPCLDTTATCSLMMASRKTLSEHRENMAARTVCQNTVWMDNRF